MLLTNGFGSCESCGSGSPTLLTVPPAARTRARAQKRPALTAGGRREAEMATPTRLPALPPNTDRATPESSNQF
jgi:hypothetical protein